MMEMPSGSRAMVQDGLDEAAQSLFSAADVPLARAEELRAAVTSPAVRAVLEMRIEQIVKHGHTAQRDAELPLYTLLKEARDTAQMALDCLPEAHRNYPVARRRAVKAAAMLLAWVDRFDSNEGKQE